MEIHTIRNIRGFTVIQLIIVIVFLGILGYGIWEIVKPLDLIKQQRDMQRKSDLKKIQAALQDFYKGNGYYPASSTKEPAYRIINLSNETSDWGSQFNPYMSSLPKDPSDTRQYIYYNPGTSNATRQIYYLYAALESDRDPDFCNKGKECLNMSGLDGAPTPRACGSICNCIVTSPNISP